MKKEISMIDKNKKNILELLWMNLKKCLNKKDINGEEKIHVKNLFLMMN